MCCRHTRTLSLVLSLTGVKAAFTSPLVGKMTPFSLHPFNHILSFSFSTFSVNSSYRCCLCRRGLLMCLLTYAKSGLGYKVPYFIPCRRQKQTKNKTPQVVALDASLRFTLKFFYISAIQATVITSHSSK